VSEWARKERGDELAKVDNDEVLKWTSWKVLGPCRYAYNTRDYTSVVFP
jgi:hypothetical protein